MGSRVLLVNPPGRKTYIRDYYCSKVSKSNYLFHPVDLLILSGRLAEHHELHVMDCIADRVDREHALLAIRALSPSVVIGLIGSVCLDEDVPFYQALQEPGRTIVISGDAALEDPAGWLEKNTFADAVILDFTSGEINAFLEGRPAADGSIVSRSHPGAAAIRRRRPQEPSFSLPLPRHELFTSRNYRFPFVKHGSFATVLTDYGCPFGCTFCVMASLGYKHREVSNVIAELEHLQQLGKREIFFIDQTFGSNRERLLALCKGLEPFGFGWVCYARVDLVSDETLGRMKAAGCHTIIFGVESASEEILRKYRKGYTKEQIRSAFELCRRHGIRTVATFILGLPEETEETGLETIRFLKELRCDFASFNIAVPRKNTELRRDAIRDGMIAPDLEAMDQGGSFITLPTRHLSRERVAALKRRAIRSFYLRPSYLWERLRGVSSWYELKEQVSEGVSLLRNL